MQFQIILIVSYLHNGTGKSVETGTKAKAFAPVFAY
jgi:hypothetical protein